MARVVVVTPDGEEIARLIAERGFKSYAEFARTLRRPKRTRAAISYIARGGTASLDLMCQVAKALDADVTKIIVIKHSDAEEDTGDSDGEALAS